MFSLSDTEQFTRAVKMMSEKRIKMVLCKGICENSQTVNTENFSPLSQQLKKYLGFLFPFGKYIIVFFVAYTRLYKSLCRSVRPSFHWLVRRSHSANITGAPKKGFL